MLHASYGDSTLVELKKNNGELFTILIDGGTANSYRQEIRKSLESYLDNGKQIDLVIVTHTDNDHISGMNCILTNKYIASKVKRIIYNSPYAIGKYFDCWKEKDLSKNIQPKVIAKKSISRGFRKGSLNTENVNTSAIKANELQQTVYNLNKLEMELITNNGKNDIFDNGIHIKFISPTLELLKKFFDDYEVELNKKSGLNIKSNTGNYKTDYDIPFETLLNDKEIKHLSSSNMSSLAFIIYEESSEQSFLVMGDASYQVVGEKLVNFIQDSDKFVNENNFIELNYFKLSHHGSICDLNEEFLNLIKCRNYLISTDGKSFGHPDKKLIARVYNQKKNSIFYFNYKERRDVIIKEGGVIEKICKYKHEF